MDVIGRDEPGAEAEGDAGAKAGNDASTKKIHFEIGSS